MENILNIIKSLFYGVFIFLGIKTGTVAVLFWLMVFDSFLGIIKALRLGYKFSFGRLAWGIVLKISVLLIPMIVALIAKGLNLNFTIFVVTIMNILIVNEGISCITNIISAKRKKLVRNNDYVTIMLMSIRKVLVGIIQGFLSVVENYKNEDLKKEENGTDK